MTKASGRRLWLAWGFAIVVGGWMAAMTPLTAQEAYYWSYARHLALSYFDHPPMVAWGIAGGTGLLGLNVLGIRLATLCWVLGTTLCGQLLLRRFGASTGACVRWVILSVGTPFMAMEHLIANPDPPLTFFWIACFYALWRAREGGGRWWFVAGLTAGGALLSKYTSVFLGAGGVVVLLLDPAMRAQLRRKGPWLALAVAALCFAPVVIWNAQHEWASFLFQSANRFRAGGVNFHNLLKFVGEQAGMFSPFLVFLVPATLLWLWRGARSRDPRALWLLAFGMPLLVYMAFSSIYIKPKPNWVVPAFVPLAMAVVLFAESTRFEARRPRLSRVLIAGIVASALVAAASPALQFVSAGKGSSWVGWDEVALRVDHWRTVQDRDNGATRTFLFAPDYRDASQLVYHLSSRAGEGDVEHEVLAQNVFGSVALQYDYWTNPRRHIGEDAVFVVIRPEARPLEPAQARVHFQRVEKVERVMVRRFGNVVMVADVFVCHGYLGPRRGS